MNLETLVASILPPRTAHVVAALVHSLVRADGGGIIFGPASDEFACFRVQLDGDEAYVAECVDGVVAAMAKALAREKLVQAALGSPHMAATLERMLEIAASGDFEAFEAIGAPAGRLRSARSRATAKATAKAPSKKLRAKAVGR